ncbi:MAG: ABC transporter ATP-binding protein, partial [Desulfobacterales bacterium]|nr:ABC transporter ATP-binding protein [Desulfobacterales bacterium]
MIDVQNLTKFYNDFCAVDRISLTIQPGEVLGLLGPNGAGKTTTLRMLTGFYTPTSGTISVNGLTMPQDTLKIKAMMGYLPESAPLYHNMLVYDYLEYVARIKGITSMEERQNRLKQLSSLCDLSAIMAKPISNLSKGLKQRVGLAHAMMTDPEILILDEPTSGLDPNQIAEIRDIVRDIGREKTIIFSTHILSEAEATCDRIVIINKGKVVADDTTTRLKQGVNNFIRLSLSGTDKSKADALLKSIDSQLEVRSVMPNETQTVSFEIRHQEGKDLREPIYQKIKDTDWILTEFTRESQGLET